MRTNGNHNVPSAPRSQHVLGWSSVKRSSTDPRGAAPSLYVSPSHSVSGSRSSPALPSLVPPLSQQTAPARHSLSGGVPYNAAFHRTEKEEEGEEEMVNAASGKRTAAGAPLSTTTSSSFAAAAAAAAASPPRRLSSSSDAAKASASIDYSGSGGPVRGGEQDVAGRADVGHAAPSTSLRGPHRVAPLHISDKTPRRELIGIVSDLQTQLNARTDSVNAIQRNFERLGERYRRDQTTLQRTLDELARYKRKEEEESSASRVLAVMQAELTAALEAQSALQEAHTALQQQREAERQALEGQLSELRAQCTSAQAEAAGAMARATSAATALVTASQDRVNVEQEEATGRDELVLTRVLSFTTLYLTQSRERMILAMRESQDAGDARTSIKPEPSLATASPLAPSASPMEHAVEEVQCCAKDVYAVVAEYVEPALRRARQFHTDASEQWRKREEAQLASRCLSLCSEEVRARGVVTQVETHTRVLLRCVAREQRRSIQSAQQSVQAARDEVHRLQIAVQKAKEETEAARVAHAAKVLELEEQVRVAGSSALSSQDAEKPSELVALRCEVAQLRTRMQEQMRAHHETVLALEATAAAAAAAQRDADKTAESTRTASSSTLESAVKAHEKALKEMRASHGVELKRLRERSEYQLSQVEKSCEERESRLAEEVSRLQLLLTGEEAKRRSEALAHATGVIMTDERWARHALLLDEHHAWSVASAAHFAGIERAEVDAAQATAHTCKQQREALQREEAEARVTLLQSFALSAQQLAASLYDAELRALHTDANAREQVHRVRHGVLQRACDDALNEADNAQKSEQLQRKELEAARAELKDLQRCLFESQRALHTMQTARQRLEDDAKGAAQRLLAAEEGSESSYACSLCLKLFADPVTCVPCGHTFCEACFVECQQKRRRGSAHRLFHDLTPWYTNEGEVERLFCVECGIDNVRALVHSQPLLQLASRFQYRRSVLREIAFSLTSSSVPLE